MAKHNDTHDRHKELLLQPGGYYAVKSAGFKSYVVLRMLNINVRLKEFNLQTIRAFFANIPSLDEVPTKGILTKHWIETVSEFLDHDEFTYIGGRVLTDKDLEWYQLHLDKDLLFDAAAVEKAILALKFVSAESPVLARVEQSDGHASIRPVNRSSELPRQIGVDVFGFLNGLAIRPSGMKVRLEQFLAYYCYVGTDLEETAETLRTTQGRKVFEPWLQLELKDAIVTRKLTPETVRQVMHRRPRSQGAVDRWGQQLWKLLYGTTLEF